MELRKWAGYSIYIPRLKAKSRRADAARNMLDNGMSVADAARAICERFSVTMRTAQRDVSDSRKMSR